MGSIHNVVNEPMFAKVGRPIGACLLDGAFAGDLDPVDARQPGAQQILQVHHLGSSSTARIPHPSAPVSFQVSPEVAKA